MCGLLGMLCAGPDPLTPGHWVRLRDTLAHRGPDGAGLWTGPAGPRPGPHAALAHRRLAVLDPSPAGAQPMATPDGRFVLVYNGELYNEPELRATLLHERIPLATGCDTETLLWWLATRGEAGLADLRGMYALALLDRARGRLTLARDPLGIKPLCWWRGRWRGSDLLLFASEPTPILAHPAVSPEPDPVGISAYLSTIRTALGDRTLFKGLRALPPGGVLRAEAAPDRLRTRADALGLPDLPAPETPEARTEQVRCAVTDSVARHLRADVPACCLLSGGLDSAIVTRLASRRHPALRTYCAGARDEAPIDGVPQSDDFRHALLAAEAFGTIHSEAALDAPLFLDRWPEMVRRLGVPLSTPNEVAINEVARRLRADGCVVTLSGEGADELFGGYGKLLGPLAEEPGDRHPGLAHLALASWIGPECKADVLQPAFWEDAQRDSWLLGWHEQAFDAAARGDDPLADHLRFQRVVNLAGLLQRLDSATMLESVEGRTPFADLAVASVAESLPSRDRFVPPDGTKVALRRAFARNVPGQILRRPKASFPLPFQRWMTPEQTGKWIGESEFLRSIARGSVLEQVARDPGGCWHLAWPLANLALWARTWWPERPGARAGRVDQASAAPRGSPGKWMTQ